ncbi:Transmembrane_emp24 domain-containing protein [Hexamita inflata]|uniref:Transmembrane emp24 domain-containing protein n=1 Tax=Hexamita inflata TaxID=28002 RepID=A0AA86NLL3_9EUKA|nr:Transmembrane emp24 domain-containing protein [Hexamita inflata]
MLYFLSFQIEFKLQQGKTFCFDEDVPRGAKIYLTFGASQLQTQPYVNFSLLEPDQTPNYQRGVNANDSVSHTAFRSGIHKLCFTAAESTQQNISRDVFIEMEQTIVVHNFDDKFEAANQANLLSQAVISEQDYAKERVRELENASQRMNRAMIFTVVFSIFAAWATVLSQNSWLAVQIRKRM